MTPPSRRTWQAASARPSPAPEWLRLIEASQGMRFDPREHEAVANVPGTGRPGGEIVDVLRRGYRLRDRVIRPALVAVAEDGTAGDETDESIETNPLIN